MTDNSLIDRLIIGRTEPHIYAFETGTVPNYLKVGDTYRPVEIRLDEWRRYFADLQKKYDEPAIAGKDYFRDLSVHRYIINEKGRKRLERTTIPNLPYYSNEFFENATVCDVEEAVKDIRQSATDKDGRYKLYSMEDGRVPVDFHYERGKETLPLRPNQKEVVRNFMAAIKRKRTHLLMYAVMRFGKSFTAMSCAKEIDAQLVVVVSAKADVKTEWKKTVESIKNFEGYEFVDSDNLSRDHSLVSKARTAGKKLVVCLTLQDLCSEEIKERHKDLFANRMFILQELRSHIYDINADANGNSNLQNRMARELQVSPIAWMNKNHLQEVTPNNILDAVREYSRERSVLDEATEIPVDHGLSDVEEINKLIMRQQPIGSRGGLKMKPVEDDEAGDLDYPDSEPGADTSEKSDRTTSEVMQDKEDNLFDKRYATFCSRILLFAFLTKDTVISLEDIVHVSNRGKENKRIIANLGLETKMLRLLFKHLNPNVLHQLDYKIQNINSLSHDETLSAMERVENAMRKFGRWSTSEIVTPQFLARRMLNDIPRERVMPTTKFMDLASKEGEFAYAIIQVFGDSYKDKIYSIPTSSIAYEFTRKVYEALGMPIENIEDKFNSYDLIGKNAEAYIRKVKKMCIDIAVGNPPYQDEGGSGGTNDAPIFQDFCDVANDAACVSDMVIPSKWFTGGREHLLGDFRREMLASKQIVRMTAYHNPRELFPEVEVKGGICCFVRDKAYEDTCEYSLQKDGDCESTDLDLSSLDVMIREPRLARIVQMVVEQVLRENQEGSPAFVEEIISGDTPFGIPTNPKTSKKNPFDVSDVQTEEYNVELYYLENNVRKVGYVKEGDIRKNSEDIDSIKVYIPKAGGSGNDKIVLGQPIVVEGKSVCSQTYVYAKFNTQQEANNFVAYLKTRFFRLLVSSMKITQDALAGVYHFVPMLDLTHEWTDEELYAKYGIEQYKDYIESMIKPMD